MPFMAVFMLDLGLTPFQTGIARGAEPLLHLAVGPLWGSLSDRYSRHKTILIMAVVLPAVFYFSTQFVPPVKVTHCNSSFVSEIGDVWTRTHHQIQLKIDDVTIVPVGDGNDTNNARTRNRMGSWVDRVHQTQLKIDNSVLNQNLQRIPNDSLSSNGPPTESPSTTKPMKTQTDSTLTFLLMMLLVSGGRLFLSPFNPILDSTVVRMTKEHTGSDFGRQRMFASFGFGTFSVISGAAIDAFGRNYPDRNKYTPMFYMYASMLVLVLIPVSFMKFPPHSRPPQAIYRNVCALFLKLDFVAFLLAAFGSGFSLGAINTFLFIFIAELHGPHILMGLNLTVTCISEAACLFFSKQMIQWLGHKNIFIIVIFCYGVRHLAYSMIHNPWLVVPVALLHGICFGAFWPACTSYVNIIAPVGMEASVQSIAHSTYFGLGEYVKGYLNC